MKINDVYFLKSCGSPSQFPEYQYPEIAFLGRSNVGKSSLINMLMNRKNLVKTGSRPGVTRTVNFFILNNVISIADLPGFGYANMPWGVKRTFMPLIKRYITGRDNLKLAFLLIDIRRVPERRERELLALLAENKIPVAVILTKCDKLPRGRRTRNIKSICAELGVDDTALFPTSAKTRSGRKELLDLIAEYAGSSAVKP
ncbi:MAG: hypothetical protein A2W19_03985 [Spirochaetes bacterium RBG_16_49_21]|nr:MAG: hypothetical protein A2W19_03985 [Spirochaetes bacterium RBG_16_49_21]